MKSIMVFGFLAMLSETQKLTRRFLSRIIRGKKFVRNPSLINEIYEPLRAELLQNLNILSFDEYCLNQSEPRWNLLYNKICFGVHKQIRQHHLGILLSHIKSVDCQEIIEIGSGDGNNLIFLAREFKDRNFIGLELSKTSVALSSEAAKKFGVNNVKFHVADLSNPKTFEKYIHENSFVFSMHCLEEMPRIFKIPLLILQEKRVRNIVLIEPAYQFSFSRFFLDIARLLRIFSHDRLFGLISFCKTKMAKTYELKIVDLGTGLNPINPSSLIVMKSKIC